MDKIKKSAVISPCGKYRYSLSRIWDHSADQIIFVGLNPSTADADKDDPTIRKLVAYSKRWGYGGFTIVNIFAYRSTDPALLLTLDKTTAIGELNGMYLRKYLGQQIIDKKKYFPEVVIMWGTKGYIHDQHKSILEWLQFLEQELHCFELSKDGYPKHPLYLPLNLKPVLYEYEETK